MNHFYSTTGIFQATNIFEASTSNSSAINVRVEIDSAARRLPRSAQHVIPPSVGEVSLISPLWDSVVPVEVIQQETFSPPGVGNVHIDWLETPDAHVFKADVSGMRRQDLQVAVEGGPVVLQISVERVETWPLDNVNRRRVERWIGGFMRRFCLPDNVVLDRIRAELDLGILTVTIPKIRRFPSVQWFIPIRAADRGRSSQAAAAAGSLTDAFPPARASHLGTDEGLRQQISKDEDQGQRERYSVATGDEERGPSKEQGEASPSTS